MNGLPDQAFPTEENRPMHSSSKGFEPALDISPEKRASIQDFVSSLADFPVVIRRAELNVASTVFLGVS